MAQISGCSKTVTQLNQITGCTDFDSSFLLLIVDTINGETMNIPVQTIFDCMGDNNYYLTAGTYSAGYIYFSGVGTNFAVDVNALLDDTNTYVTGATLSGDTLILERNDGGVIYTDLSSLVFSGSSSGEFTGNTSGNCIVDLWVRNIHGCSPVTLWSGFKSPDAWVVDDGCFAFGDTSAASGTSAFAFGQKTWAIGVGANAFGGQTIAYGKAAHAEGSGGTATNVAAHVEGYYNRASGISSHAEGGGYIHPIRPDEIIAMPNVASGNAAHAEGLGVTASGMASHAQNIETLASGEGSHAQGRSTIASARSAHAQNEFTCASGMGSHAGGRLTIASGHFSFAHGYSDDILYPIVAYGDYSFNASAILTPTIFVVSGAVGTYSYILGGYNNTVYGKASGIIGGRNNLISGLNNNSLYNIILGGDQNEITGGSACSIVGGYQNLISDSNNTNCLYGSNNKIYRTDYGLIGGVTNYTYESDYSINFGGLNYIFGGNTNLIYGVECVINLSTLNNIYGGRRVIISGGSCNSIVGVTDATLSNGGYNIIAGGQNQEIDGHYFSGIFAGSGNTINTNNLGGYGDTNNLSGYCETIIGGKDNALINSFNSTILGGQNNYLQNSQHSNIITSENCVISGTSDGAQHSIINSIDCNINWSKYIHAFNYLHNIQRANLTQTNHSILLNSYDINCFNCRALFVGHSGALNFKSSGLATLHSKYCNFTGITNSFVSAGSNIYVNNFMTEHITMFNSRDININDETRYTILLGVSGITNPQSYTTYVSNLVVHESRTITGSGDTYGVVGQITWDDNYVYVKTNAGWKRSALELF